MKHCPYWSPAWLLKAKEAQTFKELGDTALRVVKQFPADAHGKITQVCGPVSTGGFNSVKLNFLVLAEAVRLLREQGKYVFDQTPLESQFVRLGESWMKKNKGYCWPILYDVYLPIFKSGLIGEFLFLPGWESSAGSCWERSQGIARGIKTLSFPPPLYQKILTDHNLE